MSTRICRAQSQFAIFCTPPCLREKIGVTVSRGQFGHAGGMAAAFLALILVAAAGCATVPRAAQTPVAAVPVEGSRSQVVYQTPAPAEGSLWTDNGCANLFTDMRARREGDLVTIRISESPKARLNAKTKTSRDSGIQAGISDLMGFMKALEASNNNLDRTSLYKASFKPTFTGEGTNDREGSMVAYITARVTRVLPDGNLVVGGSREIRVNNETQYINISGIIRPEDIDPNNEIQSTYIADARIEYSGRGVIADKQRPGWLMRGLDYVWPF